MTPNSRYLSRLDLACEQSAVRHARKHAEVVLREWGFPDDIAFDALTIVAELSSNAVRHAGVDTQPFDPSGGQPRVPTCALVLWISGGRLCLSMSDESPEPPVLRPESDDAVTGRGVRLIAGLSEGAWGYQPANDRPGKIVWAWLRLPARRPRASTPEADGRAESVTPTPLSTSYPSGARQKAVSA
ncbi:ATP-binding protein [Streptomyces sp. NBC_01476]|uniref:ATP-binding protein n=1 Tax=Streptomyces sp. NBC_01476 TaxID=2903881 RepID=UPI002E347DF2|nr:ATP-binding protein [Streptomyces sp. NBC_01476]